MKRGKIILIIVIAVVLILALGLSLFLFSTPKFSEKSILKDPLKAMEACAKEPNDKQTNCYLKISEVLRTENPDISFQACSLIKDSNLNDKEDFKKECVKGLIDTQNTTDEKVDICRKIEKDEWKKEFIENISIEETDQKKAVEICNEISELNFREHCYKNIIDKSSNLDKDVELSMCDSKLGSDKDNCYRGIAENFLRTNLSKSIEVCNKISNIDVKDNCLNNFINSPELVKNNSDLAVSLCGSFVLKSRCYNDVAKTLSGSEPKKAVEVCKKLSDDTLVLDCYGNVWFSFNSLVVNNSDFTINMCNVLTLKKDECLKKIVSVFIDLDRSKAEEICKLMSASGSSSCLNEVKR